MKANIQFCSLYKSNTGSYDLGVRTYLQDEVVSRVPCHRKGMCACLRVLGLQLSLYVHYCLDTTNFTQEISISR